MTNQQKAESIRPPLPRPDLTDPYERLRLTVYLRTMRTYTTRDRRLRERRQQARTGTEKRKDRS